MTVNWNYYDDEKFEKLNGKYLMKVGEGETKATQTIAAINKLIYGYYNDGDVYDNTYHLEGWANDLSDYANWLYDNTDTQKILDKISNCYNESDYEDLLKELADKLFDEKYLAELNKIEKDDTIYEYDGKFKFVEEVEDEDDYYDYDDYENEDEEEDEE